MGSVSIPGRVEEYYIHVHVYLYKSVILYSECEMHDCMTICTDVCYSTTIDYYNCLLLKCFVYLFCLFIMARRAIPIIAFHGV